MGGLWSTFFLVAKKNMAKMRGLIHFYKLNLHLEYAHFKMEGLHIVRNLLRRRDHMAKVDMSDFFFHYPIELKAAGTFAPCGGAGSCGECKRCCPAQLERLSWQPRCYSESSIIYTSSAYAL